MAAAKRPSRVAKWRNTVRRLTPAASATSSTVAARPRSASTPRAARRIRDRATSRCSSVSDVAITASGVIRRSYGGTCRMSLVSDILTPLRGGRCRRHRGRSASRRPVPVEHTLGARMTVTGRFTSPEGTALDKESLRQKYLEERDKRLRPDGNDQYLRLTGRLAYYLDDPYTPKTEREPKTDH